MIFHLNEKTISPKLTWRDMQHLVVQTANPGNLQTNDWMKNGVGRKVSHSFGYGLMDAQAMVAAGEFFLITFSQMNIRLIFTCSLFNSSAKEWVTVPPQKICETRSNPINR